MEAGEFAPPQSGQAQDENYVGVGSPAGLGKLVQLGDTRCARRVEGPSTSLGPRISDDPRIVVPYYQTDYDRRTIVKATHAMRAILATPEMQSLGAEEYYPGPSVSTDEEIVHHSLNSGPYGYHTLGT